jgi:hypothetical protein
MRVPTKSGITTVTTHIFTQLTANIMPIKKPPLLMQTSEMAATLFLVKARCFNMVIKDTQQICTFFLGHPFFCRICNMSTNQNLQ